MNVTPSTLLDTVVSELGLSEKALMLDDKMYRPTVFQNKATEHYVCCFLPISIVPIDMMNGLNTQYENYVSGSSTNGYIFFEDKDPELLISTIVNWYKDSFDN